MMSDIKFVARRFVIYAALIFITCLVLILIPQTVSSEGRDFPVIKDFTQTTMISEAGK